MDPKLYGRIVNTCIAVVVIAVVALDRTTGVLKGIIILALVASGVISVGAYFYNQYLFENPSRLEDKESPPQASSKNRAEAMVRDAIRGTKMKEAEYILWTHKMWMDHVNQTIEEDD